MFEQHVTDQCSESSVETDSCCLKCENCKAAVGQQVRLEAEILSLISQREEIKSKISITEEKIAVLEAQLLNTKNVLRQLKKHDLLCPACNQIKNPRERKQIILQEIHREVLNDKPKELLCMFGLFKLLEVMINQGVMDTQVVPVEYLCCRKCRQVIVSSEAKTLFACDLAEVLVELEEQVTSGCSCEGVCAGDASVCGSREAFPQLCPP